jgi:hypothetical protein
MFEPRRPRGVSLGGAWTSGRVNWYPSGECGRFDVGVGGRGISMYLSRSRTSKIQALGQREASRCLGRERIHQLLQQLCDLCKGESGSEGKGLFWALAC